MPDNNNTQALASIAFENASLVTDGTRIGTHLIINGEKVTDLKSVSITFWDDDYGDNVSLRYSAGDKYKNVEPGEMVVTTQYSLKVPIEPVGDDASTKASISASASIDKDIRPRDHLADEANRSKFAQLGVPQRH